TALVAREFEGQVRRLDDLFTEEQRRVISIVLQDRFEDYQRTFERLANQDEDLLNRLGRLHYPIPKPLRAAAAAYLDYHFRAALANPEADGDLAPIKNLVERGRAWGYQPERELLSRTASQSLGRLLHDLGPHAELPGLIDRASRLLDASA